MEPVTVGALRAFLERLGQRSPGGNLYLLGGSALALLGNSRITVDIDYTFETEPGMDKPFEEAIGELADEMHLDAESIPIGEFVPLPPNAHERRQLVGHYGHLTVYVFDPYTIALSKIARGFDADFEDVLFLLREGVIEFEELERHFGAVLPHATRADIVPNEFRDYFAEVRRRWMEERT